MRTNALLIAAALIAMLAGAGCLNSPAPVKQPLAFSHKLHMKQDVECGDCHKHATTGPHSTIVLVENCMDCHDEAQGKDPEEPKVREYSEKNQEIPWVQVNHLPGDVYFSHSVHVKLAKMKCQECHGDLKDQITPITVPNMHLTMGQCIRCHQKKGARFDCATCHK